MTRLALMALLTLAACGAGGAPIRPVASVAVGTGTAVVGLTGQAFSLGLAL